jgi:hypothetical protein
MTRIGFPHSGISGSKAACASPKHFVAYHALHRLLPPRHPPCALSSLTSIQPPFPAREAGIVSRRECLSYLGVSFRLTSSMQLSRSTSGRPVPPAKSKSTTASAARQPRPCRPRAPLAAAPSVPLRAVAGHPNRLGTLVPSAKGGGGGRIRTADPLLAKQMLSH